MVLINIVVYVVVPEDDVRVVRWLDDQVEGGILHTSLAQMLVTMPVHAVCLIQEKIALQKMTLLFISLLFV